MKQYALQTYYENFLKQVLNLSDSSVGHYTQALRKISKMLKERGKIVDSIYEVQDVDSLELLKSFIFNDPDFLVLNKTGHQMYSAGLNRYMQFAYGQDFADVNSKLNVLDMPMPALDAKVVQVVSRSRSSMIKVQALESASYKCEFDATHRTFTAKSTNHPYMEAHHFLAIKYQNQFKNSLDIYANVVCLCPVCHRLLHYGVANEKQVVIDKLYHDRADRLAKCGIIMAKDDFVNLLL